MSDKEIAEGMYNISTKVMTKLTNKWIKHKTKNFTKIPLLHILFDYQKYIKDGDKGSCRVYFHPDFENDRELQNMLFDVIDYIRTNYDMERFTKI